MLHIYIRCMTVSNKVRRECAFRIYQCTLQLQFYQKSGKGCIAVVYSTPAIVNIIIWWGYDRVVDHYIVFAPTKSVIYCTLRPWY